MHSHHDRKATRRGVSCRRPIETYRPLIRTSLASRSSPDSNKNISVPLCLTMRQKGVRSSAMPPSVGNTSAHTSSALTARSPGASPNARASASVTAGKVRALQWRYERTAPCPSRMIGTVKRPTMRPPETTGPRCSLLFPGGLWRTAAWLPPVSRVRTLSASPTFSLRTSSKSSRGAS
jgi:hypothetical protein